MSKPTLFRHQIKLATRNNTRSQNIGSNLFCSRHLKQIQELLLIFRCHNPYLKKGIIYSSSSNFISNKYMKTSIYNTIVLMITAMFTCTLLVATRKSRGLSSWLPSNVTSNLVTRPPGPARRSWHIGTLEVVSRNEFYRMDFTLSND